MNNIVCMKINELLKVNEREKRSRETHNTYILCIYIQHSTVKFQNFIILNLKI